MELRKFTIAKFRQSVEQSNFFVFTMGLTESWFDEKGFEYPMCPGTVAGEFSPDQHRFFNQPFKFIKDNLLSAIAKMRELNPKLKFILTVSPVPLTATASGNHVLTATMHSKSLLRAVAATVSDRRSFVDYFPSYEIINSPAFKGVFFDPNLRTVNSTGVNFVMNSFFKCQQDKFGHIAHRNGSKKYDSHDVNKVDEHCEEALLEAFGK